MYYITIDCGTTNSRAYVVDAEGKVYGKATEHVGVRDTSMTGSRDKLRSGLRKIVAEAIDLSGIDRQEISAVLSSGMITSEIGLKEIPHQMAPCSLDDLSKSITKIDDAGIIDDIPVYFIRGIKNHMEDDGRRPMQRVGELDFMRGEETQLAGMLCRKDMKLPATVVILSSHTKFNAIDGSGTVLGSLTTMSGQVYAAVKDATFVGKSVEQRDNAEPMPEDYFDETIVEDAVSWIRECGLVRSLMFTRFADVLLHTKWYERHLFYDALVAAEDTLAIHQMKLFTDKPSHDYYLIGNKERCRLYEYLIRSMDPEAKTVSITDESEIDELSIKGILHVAGKAGIVK